LCRYIVGVLLVLQTFTMFAQVLVNPTIIALVPGNRRDKFIRWQTAFTQLTQSLCPLIINPAGGGVQVLNAVDPSRLKEPGFKLCFQTAKA
jgi:hypothetical protein